MRSRSLVLAISWSAVISLTLSLASEPGAVTHAQTATNPRLPAIRSADVPATDGEIQEGRLLDGSDAALMQDYAGQMASTGDLPIALDWSEGIGTDRAQNQQDPLGAPSVEVDGVKYHIAPLAPPPSTPHMDALSLRGLGATPARLAGCRNEGWYDGGFTYGWEGGGPGDPYDLHVYRYVKSNQCSYFWYIGDPLYTAMSIVGKYPPYYNWVSSDKSGYSKIRINIGLSFLHNRGLVGDVGSWYAAYLTRVAWSPWG